MICFLPGKEVKDEHRQTEYVEIPETVSEIGTHVHAQFGVVDEGEVPPGLV